MARLDSYLFAKGYYASRERAKRAVLEGCVRVDGKVVRRPSLEVCENSGIEADPDPVPFVSRGGVKLEKALSYFQIDPKNFICLDIGASTGGFTQVLLQHGASCVVALDVGHDQLAPELRRDARVVNLENTDIRDLSADEFDKRFDMITVDVSFVSLRHILPCLPPLLKPKNHCVFLIKPQFELNRKALNKKGIVTEPRLRKRAVAEITEFTENLGFRVKGVTESPIQGGDGNTEYLLCAEYFVPRES